MGQANMRATNNGRRRPSMRPPSMEMLVRASHGDGGIFGFVGGDGPGVVAFEGINHFWMLDKKRPWFVSGSGEGVGLPFLAFVSRVLWQGRVPLVDDAVLAVRWTLGHAIDHVAIGVGGDAHVAVLRVRAGQDPAVQQLGPDELAPYTLLISEMEQALRDVGRGGTDKPVPS